LCYWPLLVGLGGWSRNTVQDVGFMHGVWRISNRLKMELNRAIGVTTIVTLQNLRVWRLLLEIFFIRNQIVTVQLRLSIEAIGPLKRVPRVIF
jgi:hypothetical protein